MTALLLDPLFWLTVTGALFGGFVVGLLILAKLRVKSAPRVIGAIRPRCGACGNSHSYPRGGRFLCLNCWAAEDDEASGRTA